MQKMTSITPSIYKTECNFQKFWPEIFTLMKDLDNPTSYNPIVRIIIKFLEFLLQIIP